MAKVLWDCTWKLRTENRADPKQEDIFLGTNLEPTYWGVKVEVEMIEVLNDKEDNGDNEDTDRNFHVLKMNKK